MNRLIQQLDLLLPQIQEEASAVQAAAFQVRLTDLTNGVRVNNVFDANNW